MILARKLLKADDWWFDADVDIADGRKSPTMPPFIVDVDTKKVIGSFREQIQFVSEPLVEDKNWL